MLSICQEIKSGDLVLIIRKRKKPEISSGQHVQYLFTVNKNQSVKLYFDDLQLETLYSK